MYESILCFSMNPYLNSFEHRARESSLELFIFIIFLKDFSSKPNQYYVMRLLTFCYNFALSFTLLFYFYALFWFCIIFFYLLNIFLLFVIQFELINGILIYSTFSFSIHLSAVCIQY